MLVKGNPARDENRIKDKMKTHTETEYSIATRVNKFLASIPADKRPQTSFHQSIESVAYSARGYYEATTSNGQTEFVSTDTVLGWLK